MHAPIIERKSHRGGGGARAQYDKVWGGGGVTSLTRGDCAPIIYAIRVIPSELNTRIGHPSQILPKGDMYVAYQELIIHSEF